MLTVVPIFSGCRLNAIKLIGYANAEERSQISYVDNLMIKKYGKGVEDGYTDLVLSNGEILDGLYGTQSALLQMKDGDAVVATRKKLNDATSGRRLWKSKGVQIELFYRQDIGMIEIEYKSINYLMRENEKKDAEENANNSIKILLLQNLKNTLDVIACNL